MTAENIICVLELINHCLHFQHFLGYRVDSYIYFSGHLVMFIDCGIGENLDANSSGFREKKKLNIDFSMMI